jgi:hypothetical protein
MKLIANQSDSVVIHLFVQQEKEHLFVQQEKEQLMAKEMVSKLTSACCGTNAYFYFSKYISWKGRKTIFLRLFLCVV